MSRDSKMCAAQFAKGMGIGLGVGMAVGAAAGLMMQPQKKRANGIVADAVRTVSDVTDTIRDTLIRRMLSKAFKDMELGSDQQDVLEHR